MHDIMHVMIDRLVLISHEICTQKIHVKVHSYRINLGSVQSVPGPAHHSVYWVGQGKCFTDIDIAICRWIHLQCAQHTPKCEA